MKVAVFGATGNVGLQVIEQGLAEGHSITALARNKSKLEKFKDQITIIEGDVLDKEAVMRVLDGQDAVICTLGMPLRNKEGLRARGTESIVSAMEEKGLKRLICLSGLGAGDSFDQLSPFYRYFIFPVILKHVFKDHNNQEEIVRASSLDWTLVRPGNFIKGGKTGLYQHGFKTIGKDLKIKISHGDVADFILKQLSSNYYIGHAPGLSY